MDAYRAAVSLCCSLALVGSHFAQCEFATLTLEDPSIVAEFGSAVALDANTAAIAAPHDAGVTKGAVTIFERNGLNWYHEATLRAPDAVFSNGFGSAVALSGDLLVVGASLDNEGGSNVGAAYVFERVGGTWMSAAKLLPAAPVGSSRFGSTLAIDGSTLFIAGVLDDRGGARAGGVWVFEREGPSWGEQAFLLPNSAGPGSRVGDTLAVGSGRLLIGAPLDNDAGYDAGVAWVFERDALGSWLEVGRLSSVDGEFSRFGGALALGGDRLLVGAVGTAPNGRGNAFVYEDNGTDWTLVERLVSQEPRVYALGQSLALINGGTVAVVCSTGGPVGRGFLHVFGESAGWMEVAARRGSDDQSGDQFGWALSADGDVALVGAFRHDGLGLDTGKVYSFSLSETLCPTLIGRPAAISLAAGGVQDLRFQAGPEFGGRAFIAAGTVSGTGLGRALGAWRIPLGFDDYFLLTLGGGPGSPLSANTGSLNPTNGRAEIKVVIPAGSDPALAGLTLHHAFVVLGGGGTGLVHVSNPLSLQLDP